MELILDTIDDLVLDFVVYDRDDDEGLPKGSIEAAITAGEVSIEQIVSRFREALLKETKP